MNSIKLEKNNNNIDSMNNIKKKKHKAIRSCIVCRKRQEKDKLFRIANNGIHELVYDKLQKENSRAIYICKDRNCLEKLKNMIEKGKLKISIKIDLSKLNIVIDELENELGE